MKALLASFLTIGLFSFPVSAETEAPTGSPEPGILQRSFTEEGEEKEFSVGANYRSQFIYPSNFGTAGIFRTRSAESLPEGTLTFGIGGEFYSVTNAPNVKSTGTNANTIAESLFLGFSPNNRLTFSFMRRSSSTTFGNPSELISSLGDFSFSMLYTFPIIEKMLAIAPLADIIVASDFNDLAPETNTTSAGVGLAASLSFYSTFGIPLFIHGNLIYHMPNLRQSPELITGAVRPETFFLFSRFHTLTTRLGAEIQVGNFIPFLEMQQRVHLDSSLAWADSPSHFSLGTRITPFDNKSLAFLLGGDVGLGKGLVAGVPFNPDWQLIGQLSYTTAVESQERKHYATTKDVKVVNRKFVISKNINFKVGSAELEEESKYVLDQIAQVVLENKVTRLHIVGHTDSSHTDDYNNKLSIDRANTVKTYLGRRGVAEEGLTTQGYGKRKPKASNLTETGRAVNRRVEFFILD